MTATARQPKEIHRLTEEQAERVYKLLFEHCGASAQEDDVASFVHEFTRTTPTSEYRFIGALGMGGKFRFPRFSVDCYPEDSNTFREKMIAEGNAALALLKSEIQTSQQ